MRSEFEKAEAAVVAADTVLRQVPTLRGVRARELLSDARTHLRRIGATMHGDEFEGRCTSCSRPLNREHERRSDDYGAAGGGWRD